LIFAIISLPFSDALMLYSYDAITPFFRRDLLPPFAAFHAIFRFAFA